MTDPDFFQSEFSDLDEEDHFFQSFELKKILGAGMFGRVYHAYSSSHKSDVALKIIKKAGFSKEKLNFLRYEELILSQLDHPNVVQFFLVKNFFFFFQSTDFYEQNFFFFFSVKRIKQIYYHGLGIGSGGKSAEFFQ